MHEYLQKFVKLYRQHKVLVSFAIFFLIVVTQGVILILASMLLPVVAVYYLIYFIKTLQYYKTDEFISIKSKLEKKIIEYNEFDHFMDETRDFIKQQQFLLTTSNVKNSTLTVYKNSKLDIYKYIVKYFFINTKIDEKTMQIIESILQKYNTINKTYEILADEFNSLMEYIQKHMYKGAYIFYGMTMKKLGSRKLPKFEKNYYMWYSFDYHSPTNRESHHNTIVLDETRLEDFAQYLTNLMNYRNSAKFQRQLMTPQLREAILSRDHHTCKYCDVSREKEEHLLLEVDHINPISKGGITSEDNLQSLCWKCNRSKGNKILA